MAEAKEEHILDDDKPAITTVADKLVQVMELIEEEKEEEVQHILTSHTGLLHRACDTGWIEAVKQLLDRGVTLNQWNEAHLHPLHLAVRNNHIEIVKILLEHDPNIIDRPSNFGETPLHFACLKGHTPLVKLLLDSKADVRLDDRCGNTALHYAVSSNNPELVEYLLRDKNLVQFINKKNEFHHSPIHRAAVLQCVEVIEVLSSYRVKFSVKDKNGLTPHQLATILYDNKRTTTPTNNKGSKGDTIIIPTKRIPSPLPPLNYDQHSRSSSFSYHRPSHYSMDGSTTSLPASESGGIQKKRPSATKSNRPVNLSFAQSYSRQTSGGSSRGSRSSEIYLKDKEQAERLSEVLDKQGSLDHLEEIVLDQTSYEPPIDMSFVPPIESFTLTHDSSRFVSKDHDVKIKLNESYWRFDQNESLECKMAASLHWNGAYPSNYVFVSPICFFSCRSKRACEVKLMLPHALHFPSEKQHKRITIFCTHTVNLQETVSSPSLKEFRRLATSDLNVDTHYVSFTTTVKYPSLFTVAVATPPPTINNSLPSILPMRCFLYIASPSEREQYVTNTDILMYVAMNLKTVEMAMKKYVLPDNFVLEEKGFVMTGPVLRVHGKSEDDHWQITRRGSGIFRYNQVALSQEIEAESSMTHQQSYPLKESLFVECNNAGKVLKCRVSLECEGKELINMLITPYTPIKQYPTLDPFLLRESLNSPYDMNSVSSSESIPLRTSSV